MSNDSQKNDAVTQYKAPASTRIRERIRQSRQRFHANDNIAAFIEPGEMEELLDEVQDKMKAVLESLVIDTDSDHNTQDTARRVAKMYLNEVFKGRYITEPPVTEFPNIERLRKRPEFLLAAKAPSVARGAVVVQIFQAARTFGPGRGLRIRKKTMA